MDAFLVALGVVFVAELGDKSQLLALTLAARYRPLPVLAGLAVAMAVMQALSVTVGTVVAAAVPDRVVAIVAGTVFLAFAVATLLAGDEDDDDPDADAGGGPTRMRIAMTAGASFFVAELGDKTMLATIALAAQNGALGTWAGAVLGLVASSALAVVVGQKLFERLHPRTVRLVAATAFALVGVLMLVEAVRAG